MTNAIRSAGFVFRAMVGELGGETVNANLQLPVLLRPIPSS
jgi:hypothetical protein